MRRTRRDVPRAGEEVPVLEVYFARQAVCHPEGEGRVAAGAAGGCRFSKHHIHGAQLL